MLHEIDTKIAKYTLPGIEKGLLTYLHLMGWVQNSDVSKDTEFQRKYKGFYRVRRNDDWCQPYFSYMERSKGKLFSFEDILKHMFEATGKVEASFSSKLLATLHPDMPVWDSYVLSQLDLPQPTKGQQNKHNQLRQTISTYDQLTDWYEKYIGTQNAWSIMKVFDETFPYAKHITVVKKIDCVLWSMGAKK